MPIYEYECKKCGEKFETYRRIFDGDEGVKCPKCASDDIERQLSSFFGRTGGSSCGNLHFG